MAQRRGQKRGQDDRVIWAARIIFAGVLLVGLGYLYFNPTTPALKSASPNVLDRAFSDSVLVLFRIGLVVFGAFVAAAIALRVILGIFDVKTAWGDLAPIVEQGTEPIRVQMQSVTTQLQKSIDDLRRDTNTKFEALSKDVIEPLTETMVSLQEKIDASK
jgi:hypothetical protein